MRRREKKENEETIRAYMAKRGYTVYKVRFNLSGDRVSVTFHDGCGPMGMSRATYRDRAIEQMIYLKGVTT